MEEDISRNTLFVLVILTLVISILGTWTVLSHVDNPPMPVNRGPSDNAEVRMEITQPPEQVVTPTTGQVTFSVVGGK